MFKRGPRKCPAKAGFLGIEASQPPRAAFATSKTSRQVVLAELPASACETPLQQSLSYHPLRRHKVPPPCSKGFLPMFADSPPPYY